MKSVGNVELTGSSPTASPDTMAAKSPQQPLPPMGRTRLRRWLENEVEVLKPETLKDVVFKALRDSPVVVDVFQNLLLVSKRDIVVKDEESEDGDEDEDEEEDGDEEDGDDADGDDADGNEDDGSNSYEQEDAEAVLKAKAILRAEAMLPYAEQRKFTSQEIFEEIVSMTVAMIQSRHRPMGNAMAAESNATSSGQSKQQQSHKRSLSSYSDMPTQPDPKRVSTKKKSLVPRYERCKNCEQDFDVTENFSEACNYHDGVLEVDYEHETWIDWDENAHGHIDERLEKEYPEGFMWECCEEDGKARGCQTGWHQK
jgi:hypothetical protein